MRPLQLLRTSAHLFASALITAVLYLSGPVLGVLSTNADAETLVFETFGPPPKPVVFTMPAPQEPEAPEVAELPKAPTVVDAPSAEPKEGAADGEDERGSSPRIRKSVLTGPERMALMRAQGGSVPLQFRGQHVPSSKSRSKQKCEEPVNEITQEGADRWRVSRDFVESYTNHPKRLETLGGVARHKDAAGEYDGFRVGRIRCGSPLAQGGLHNGDVVHSVNGHKVTSLAGAVLTYMKVRGKDTVRVRITRKDEGEKTLVYKLY